MESRLSQYFCDFSDWGRFFSRKGTVPDQKFSPLFIVIRYFLVKIYGIFYFYLYIINLGGDYYDKQRAIIC